MFSYGVYCTSDNRAELPEIYASGFLPYSGEAGEAAETFFMARSLRVDLARFEDTSENRRVDRKISPLGIRLTALRKDEMDTADSVFQSFCLEYTRERFHGSPMPERRFLHMLRRTTLTHILRFDIAGKPVGYVFAAIEGNTLHYWYAFFDTSYMRDYPLGKWMMWKTIHWARENGLEYVYLGTCCMKRGLYKARDHKGLEFFAGNGWSRDMDRLKALCHADEDGPAVEEDGFRAGLEPPPGTTVVFRG